jgi:hypothetical protein
MNVSTRCLTLTIAVVAPYSVKDKTAMRFPVCGTLPASKVLAESTLAPRATDSLVALNLVLPPRHFMDSVLRFHIYFLRYLLDNSILLYVVLCYWDFDFIDCVFVAA